MNCREATEFLCDYLEGKLPLEVRIAFDEHLVRCPPCVLFLNSYRVTIELTAASASLSEAEEPCVPEELIRAILAARPSTK